METQDVFSYIIGQEKDWKTVRIPITESKDWNMYEHIQRCFNVANAWYHKGNNDGTRPYKDIVTPILNVAFRSEGFDVKDIVPYVNSQKYSYKSFLVRKFHPIWARKMELDTFIDDVVETSIIYDLVLVKKLNNSTPEVVDLQTLAFCDQTDIMSGPICIKHQYTPAELTAFKNKWDDEKIDMAIVLASDNKKVKLANEQKAETPSKYIEVYELRGNLPEHWIKEDGDPFKYVPQIHIVSFYKTNDGERNGICFFKGEDRPLSDNFKALKIDRIRSKGRACGRSIVETLFEPQVWTNYSAQKIKKLLDSAITIFQTASDEIAGQNLNELANNTILKTEENRPIQKVDGTLQNLPAFRDYQTGLENDARIIGSASDAQLGTNPVSGTPFALQNLVVQEGQGIHEYRQGKIATFFADVLYRDFILSMLVEEMNKGQEFSDELSLEEMQEIGEQIVNNEVEKKVKDKLFKDKLVVTVEERDAMKAFYRDQFMKSGKRKFFKIMKDELKDIPMDVFVNIKGKQKRMAQNADKITNIIREVIRNPQAFTQIPGIGNAFNQLLEESGMSPIDFAPMIRAVQTQEVQSSAVQDITPTVESGEELEVN